jgi:hypothetical protein
LSTALLVHCGTARGLIPALADMPAEVFAAGRGHRSPIVLSDSVAVVALSTPMRLRLSDVAAALMPETHVMDCAEDRADAAYAVLQHRDRRWWGRTR